MGTIFGKGLYTRKEITEYTTITYLTRNEIEHLLVKFMKLASSQIKADNQYRVPLGVLMEYPEFGANPFGDRLCKTFSSTGDGSLDFEDFLNCVSTFNFKAPMDTKIEYIFQMYDFDNDGEIGDDDIKETIRRLVGERFEYTPVEEICIALNKQTDLDSAGGISFTEFKAACAKNLDFQEIFKINIF
ncbi:unnamed protein product [Allacma fusca]|uniref:EF-hand domain-containing protein n=1 Tax=Allacma fusca TaxID=39272 RepID=A0A8J2K7R7_9HEXA|nr:unnamed protein product [Allacma fusca]